MDPDANLKEQRQLLKKVEEALDSNEPLANSDLERLLELTTGLDEWLSHGGFLPAAWGKRAA